MKESRIDILLAKVAFHQAIALGFGGGVFTELRDFNAARPKALIFSGTTALIFLLKVFHLYSKAFQAIKKTKKEIIWIFVKPFGPSFVHFSYCMEFSTSGKRGSFPVRSQKNGIARNV